MPTTAWKKCVRSTSPTSWEGILIRREISKSELAAILGVARQTVIRALQGLEATHPSVSGQPSEVVAVKDYKMLDVNNQGGTRVQRFVDEVDGHKVVCYFTDGYFVGSAQAGGGIYCLELR
jgi:hypothetical protein